MEKTKEQLKEEIEKSKEIELSILQDVLGDVRDQRGFFKKLCVILCVFVFILIIGIIGVSFHNQNMLKETSNRNTELFLDFLQKANVQIDTSEIGE